MTATQPTLPFARGSDTSRAAAESMILPAGSQRRRIYFWACTQQQGFTDEQMVDALKLNPSSARPRRGELVDAELLKDSGKRAATKSGRQAIVWVAMR